jgi:serine/threonine protein kinase
MELVRGIKITDYCDHYNLPTRERLQLFIQVCHAIQHAHQKGIIHRDLKPSNILVTVHDEAPMPKVIDFGIAKATEQRLTDKTLFTAFEQLIGTPAYMSPEQAAMTSLDIDTRSDIYALGVLLYELLTGNSADTDLWRRWYLAGTRCHLTLWEFNQRRLVSECPAPEKTFENGKLSSRGDLALVHRDGSLTFQRLAPLLAQTNFWPHRRGVNDIAFAPNGSIFATAGKDGIAKLWDSTTLRKIDDLKGHLLSMIRALDISPDGLRLATAAGGKEAIKLWDLRTHQELITLSTDSLMIKRIEFSRDGSKLVGCNGQGHLHIWRAPSWEEIATAEAKEKAEDQRP